MAFTFLLLNIQYVLLFSYWYYGGIIFSYTDWVTVISLLSTGYLCKRQCRGMVHILNIGPYRYYINLYHTVLAGNFRGRILIFFFFFFCKWVENAIFREKTFVDYSLVLPKNATCLHILRRKLSQVATKPRNLQKFSPSKVSHCTVCIAFELWCAKKWQHVFHTLLFFCWMLYIPWFTANTFRMQERTWANCMTGLCVAIWYYMGVPLRVSFSFLPKGGASTYLWTKHVGK